jgi:hypothetical protein
MEVVVCDFRLREIMDSYSFFILQKIIILLVCLCSLYPSAARCSDGFMSTFERYRYHKAATGVSYSGESVKRKRHGHGTLTFSNGRKYTGYFKDGLICGPGTMIYAPNVSYTGEFCNGVEGGAGIFTDGNGLIYVGQFSNGLPNGQGYITYGDKTSFFGTFRDGRRDGEGFYINEAGFKRHGFWRNGLFAGEIFDAPETQAPVRQKASVSQGVFPSKGAVVPSEYNNVTEKVYE